MREPCHQSGFRHLRRQVPPTRGLLNRWSPRISATSDAEGEARRQSHPRSWSRSLSRDDRPFRDVEEKRRGSPIPTSTTWTRTTAPTATSADASIEIYSPAIIPDLVLPLRAMFAKLDRIADIPE